MKKLITFLLLVLFLFNVVGYYGVYVGLRIQASRALRQTLDAETYDTTQTLTVKIPFTMPYQLDGEGFQRVDGDFERDGKFYSLIKQKLENDTLCVIYLVDHRQAGLFDLLTDFAQANADNPMSKKAGKLLENFTKDYLTVAYELQTASAGWSTTSIFSQTGYPVISAAAGINTPPPRVSC